MLARAALLGVAPAAFWKLSLKEWRALVAPPRTSALSRAELNALMQQHPDSQ